MNTVGHRSGAHHRGGDAWRSDYLYDNFKTCDSGGGSCIDANAYTYKYLVYDYRYQSWSWWYNGSDPNGGGWGPVAGPDPSTS